MFVQRLVDGRINGVYPRRQPGIAEEELADDNPDVVAFLTNGLQKTQAEIDAAALEAVREATITSDAGRVDLLSRLRTATAAQIDTWLTNNVTTLAQARTVLAAVIKVIALDHRD